MNLQRRRTFDRVQIFNRQLLTLLAIEERDILSDVPNAIAFQKVLETDRAGYLIRQYFFSSLYDRIRYGAAPSTLTLCYCVILAYIILTLLVLSTSPYNSTRPFMNLIEKKWVTYQLLKGLADSHARNVR